jgi:hypothetical protein
MDMELGVKAEKVNGQTAVGQLKKLVHFVHAA